MIAPNFLPDSVGRILQTTKSPGEEYQPIAAASNIMGLAERTLPDTVLAYLQDPPILWQTAGTVLKAGYRSTVLQIDIDGTPFVLKQYTKLALHRRVRYALTRTRAMQAWQAGQVMATLGLPVARPLAVLTETRLGIPTRSALLMQQLPGTTLLDLVEQGTAVSQLKQLAHQLSNVFEVLERYRITHGDMKATNIIVSPQGQLSFIDLDATKFHRSSALFWRRRKKDRLRLGRNWETHPIAAEVFRDVFGKSPRTVWQPLARACSLTQFVPAKYP